MKKILVVATALAAVALIGCSAVASHGVAAVRDCLACEQDVAPIVETVMAKRCGPGPDAGADGAP